MSMCFHGKLPTNLVVSAALVAQREVDDEAMAATEPGTTNAEATQPVEVPTKKKMMQHPVYFVSSLLQGLDQGIPACRNCSSAFLWPRGSCITTSRHTRSLSSLASLCNGYCTIQMRRGGLWNAHWSCPALASSLKVLRRSRAESWQSSLN